MSTLSELWPLAGARVRAGDLELRWIDDELAVELARLAAGGVHDPERMPFTTPWTRGTPEEVARSVLAYQWRSRAEVGPTGHLSLEFAVLDGAEPVGVQGASGTDWSVLHSVETGSWLGRPHHGRGIGTRMRSLLLHLLFDGLGAELVTSRAFDDNPASNAVSLKTGYLPNGTRRAAREGVAATLNCYAMTSVRWESVRARHALLLGAPVEIEGAAALRAQLDEPLTAARRSRG